MRDPKRIPVVLDAIRAYWEKHPDLRLGQIVVNAAQESGLPFPTFYIEDGELLRGLAYLEQEGK